MKISRRLLAHILGEQRSFWDDIPGIFSGDILVRGLLSDIFGNSPVSSLADCLTYLGLEAEPCALYGDAKGIVVGKVLGVRAHPNADKLKLCKVDIGDGKPKSIVCGAPNVREGMTVAVAPPGAWAGDIKISERKIRGEFSEGMICSAKELGIGEEAGGILRLEDELKAGANADEIFTLRDDILDVSITPNRGDCLSYLGIAREICARYGANVLPPRVKHKSDNKDVFPVNIEAPEACPFYGCVVIRGADLRPSPMWMRTFLERCGMRAINAVVDVTNYIAMLWGQPMHAFDLDKLSDGIRVRFAESGEKILLLDGVERTLAEDDLVIADYKHAAALGGVMGGSKSGVDYGTKNILLEAASFTPEFVRGKMRRYQITSEAAFRFERGVDPSLPPVALAEAARLIKKICGGAAGPINSTGEGMKAHDEIVVDVDAMRGMLGMPEITKDEAVRKLRVLGIDAKVKKGNLHARPPSWRFDLHFPADIAEEVVRSWGYQLIKETAPVAKWHTPSLPPQRFAAGRVRRFFAARGFSEIVSYAFVPREWEEQFGERSPFHGPVVLQNPISEEMAVMRTQLYSGLMSAARFNAHHRQERGALFEIGRCFYKWSSAETKGEDASLPWQPQRLGGLIWGAAQPLQWHGNRAGDFYDLKGVLEDFLAGTGALFTPLSMVYHDRTESNMPAFHPYRAVEITLDGMDVGIVGECHPRLADDWGFREPPLLFEVNLDALREDFAAPEIRAVARLPLVWRDVAMLALEWMPVGKMLEAARSQAKPPVTGVDLFDCYAGDNIPQGKKSFAVRVTLQGSKNNLTEKDINKAVERVCAALEGAGAERREAQ